MSRRHRPLSQLTLAFLALWLGLWPAADAVTGVSRTIVVEPVAATTISNGAAKACLLVEATVLSCCQLATSPEAPEPSCCGQTREQCARCFSLGGVVLMAVNQWNLEPDLDPRETLAAATEVGESRTLQPPVPPPWAIS